MSVPSIIKGQYFDVAVFYPAGASTPTVICGLTSRNLTHQVTTNDQFLRDCADPTMIPARVVNITGEQFDISGTGLYNRAQGDLIRSIVGVSLKYRFLMGEPSSDVVDSGYYEGNFVLSNLQIGAADGTNVTAQLTWVSDGQVLWTPGNIETTLASLLVTPKTVVHGVLWTGTVTGTTTGSTLAATSSDVTALTVTGTGTTRTVTGTFSAAGTPTITFTETLAGATNTPKVSTTKISVT